MNAPSKLNIRRLLTTGGPVLLAAATVGYAVHVVTPMPYVVIIRSVRIPAAPEEIFPHLKGAARWLEWLPISEEEYPDIGYEITTGGEPTQTSPGAFEWRTPEQLEWTHPASRGILELYRYVEDTTVWLELAYDSWSHMSRGDVHLERTGSETEVVWTTSYYGTSLRSRLELPLLRRTVPQFKERALANLKSLVEASSGTEEGR